MPALRLSTKAAYAAGQAGNILGDSLITGFALYFYLPPSTGEKSGVPLVPELLWDLLPVWLTLSIISRGFDSFWDPFVANWSDRSTHPFGRRRIFMLVGCLPLALSTAFVFFPPDGTATTSNVLWCGLWLTAYYVFYSVYVAPYLALLPELAPDPKENVVLSTAQAFAALVGAIAALIVGPIVATRLGVPMMAVVLAVVSFVLLAIPVVFINEKRLVAAHEGPSSTLGFWASIKETLRDQAFLPYVLGSTLFFFGFNIVRSAAPYYVEVLMRKSLDFQSVVFGATFGVAIVAFPVVAVATRRFGKRQVMIFGSALLALLMLLIPLVNSVLAGLLVLGAAGVAVSILLAVPNAILADVCNANARRTGQRREAMFFGAQGLLQKLNLGISTGLLGWLLSMGRTVQEPIGVQLSGPMAAVALVLAVFFFWRYPEQRVLNEIDAHAKNTDKALARPEVS